VIVQQNLYFRQSIILYTAPMEPAQPQVAPSMPLQVTSLLSSALPSTCLTIMEPLLLYAQSVSTLDLVCKQFDRGINWSADLCGQECTTIASWICFVWS